MEKLRNSFSSNIDYYSETGDGFEVKLEYLVDDKGQKIRKVTGKVNVYEKIQASLPSTDIYSILVRVAAGESNLLNVPNLGFIDTSNLPLDEEQRVALVSKAKEDFEKMDPAIKAAFDNSFAKFYKAVADGVAEKSISEALKSAAEAQAAAEEAAKAKEKLVDLTPDGGEK